MKKKYVKVEIPRDYITRTREKLDQEKEKADRIREIKELSKRLGIKLDEK